MTTNTRLSTLACALAATFPGVAPAQSQEPPPEASGVQSIIVTGSRVGNARTETESATPVDVIRGEEITRLGQAQLQNALSIAVPSFSVSKPSTAGALDFTSSPTLRGLGPGDLLLMINAKRRHTMGALNLNNQIGRGDVGYDFNTIPPAAIGRVEVLRDGASAVYGADAIAGVINVVLDKSVGAMASVQVGATTEGDGETLDATGGFGFNIGDGVLRTTVRYNERKRSNRAEPDTRQQYFGTSATGALTTISGNYGSGTGLTSPSGTLDPREATINRNNHWLGDSPFESGAIFFNGEFPLGGSISLYTFGGWSDLKGISQGFYRRPGDDRNVRAIHPNGFLPQQVSRFENYSAALGVKGTDLLGFGWDVSTLYGHTTLKDRIENSNNVALGLASPTAADVSGVEFAQWTSNFDLAREFALGAAVPARFAMGAEFRKEWFETIAGEPDSYRIGSGAILDGPNAGRPAPVGMQMLPGLTPDDVRVVDRHSTALYAELEQALTRDWDVTAAARFERFSDFGDTSTYKLATRYQFAPAVAVRGSYSTGFKAPHLAQSNTSTTTINFTNFVATTVRLLPVDHPAARAIGAVDLKPAKSKGGSMGLTYGAGSASLTVDAYQIEIKDRLALSTQFSSPALTSLLATLGFPGIDAAQFMTNAIDTTTKGIDITGAWLAQLGEWGTLNSTIGINWNETKLDRIADTPAPLRALGISAPLFDLTQQVRVTESTPKDKFSLGLNWRRGDWTANLGVVRYGKVATVASTSLTPERIAVLTPGYDVRLEPTTPPSANSQVVQTFEAKWITDFSVGWQLGKVLLTLGVNNAFDVYPDKNLASTVASVAVGTNGSDNAGTIPYNFTSPFGYTGRTWFARAEARF